MTTTTSDTRFTRRRLIGAALAVGVAAPIGLAGRASAASGPVRLNVPSANASGSTTPALFSSLRSCGSRDRQDRP